MPKADEIPELPTPRWVISDTHLGHANILRYCPWRQTWASSVEEHDRKIIEAWQETVGPGDWVLHLGDFALTNREGLAAYRSQLPGKICLLLGNHDRSRTAMLEAGFDLVVRRGRFLVEDQVCFCRHDPAKMTAVEADAVDVLLHGHCHGNLRQGIDPDFDSRMIDCSMDAIPAICPVQIGRFRTPRLWPGWRTSSSRG